MRALSCKYQAGVGADDGRARGEMMEQPSGWQTATAAD